MKILIYIIPLIAFALLTVTCNGENQRCDVYKCLDSNISNKLICKLTSFDNETQITTHQVRQCDNDMKCKQEITEGALCTNVFVPKEHDEPCDMNFECNSNVCVNNKCSFYPLQHQCERSMNCHKNAFCNNNTCTTLLQPQDECETSKGCPFGYACGRVSENENSKCHHMFSIKHGEYSSESLLCESGLNVNNICVDTYMSVPNENDIKRCTSNEECEYTLIKGNETETKEGKCVCSKNGEKYCELTSMSTYWKEFLAVFRKEVSEYKVNTTHVAHYRNTDINDATSKWFNNKRIQTAFRKTKAEYYGTLDCVHEYEGFSNAYINRVSLFAVLIVVLNIFLI